MAEKEKELRFICAYCGEETTLFVTVAKAQATQSKKTAIVRYCEHCNKPNKLQVPDNVDVHPFIYGKDEGFVEYRDGVPVLQGEKTL